MDKKIKLNVVIKFIGERQDKVTELDKFDSDQFIALAGVRRTVNAYGLKEEEVEKDKVVKLLEAAKWSEEIMANAFIDAERDDLFEDKMKSVNILDEIMNLVKTNQ